MRIMGRRCFATAVWLCCCGAPILGHGLIEEQIAELTTRIASAPTDASLYLMRGKLYSVHRDWDRAEADYDRALRIDPSLDAARLGRSELYLAAGRAADALAAVDAMLARRPDHGRGLVVRARALRASSRNREAIATCTRAIDGAGPPLPEHYLERAAVMVAAGHPAAALAGVEEGLARLGSVMTLELFALEMEIELARYDRGLRRIDRVSAPYPWSAQWWLRRREILESAGRPVEAVRAYRSALETVKALPGARRGTRAAADARASARKALRVLGADLSRQAAELKFIEAITAGGRSGEPETPGGSR